MPEGLAVQVTGVAHSTPAGVINARLSWREPFALQQTGMTLIKGK
jgi:hypothetical protein